jgi:hypothetical protein
MESSGILNQMGAFDDLECIMRGGSESYGHSASNEAILYGSLRNRLTTDDLAGCLPIGLIRCLLPLDISDSGFDGLKDGEVRGRL